MMNLLNDDNDDNMMNLLNDDNDDNTMKLLNDNMMVMMILFNYNMMINTVI